MRKGKRIEKFISKANLKKVLNRLTKETHLVAPSKIYGDIVFQDVKSVDDIAFDYQNCLNTPKDYLLLNDETLFRYDLDPTLSAPKCFSTNRNGGAKIVVFGSRACDTKAIGLLDKFFSREFEDLLYFGKRNNLLIITLVCSELDENCFCTSTNSGPYLEEGFDIQLVDIGEGYFLEAASSKGKDFTKKFANLMQDVDRDRKEEKEQAVKRSTDSKEVDFNLRRICGKLDRLELKDELWQDLSQRCQNCGGCLLICPTCSCFYVVDKKIDKNEGARVRSLDACYYEGFTRMSGGYNPITPKEIMIRRKFHHKLWQQCHEFGMAGCTGCGRCNEICPGNVNWLKVIKEIEKKLP